MLQYYLPFEDSLMFLSETVLSSSLSEGDYLRVLGYAYKPSVYTEDSTFLSDTTNFFSLTVSEFFSEYVSSSAGFLLSDSSIISFQD